MTGREWLALILVSCGVAFGLIMLTTAVIWPHMSPLVSEADGGVCGLLGLVAGFVAASAVERP